MGVSVAEASAGMASVVSATSTLELSGRGLVRLEGFESYGELKRLFVNRNALVSLSGLESNWRLEGLYAASNRISRLGPAVSGLLQLEELVVNDNNMEGPLDVELESLRRLNRLERLDMQDNPMCDEPEYRLRVVRALPWLRLLDRQKVTEAERQAAALLKDGEQTRRRKKRILGGGGGGAAKNNRMEQGELDAISAAVKAKRLPVRELLSEQDRRRCGRVSPEHFERVLRRLGIWRDDLLEAYATANAVDYEAFCRDVVPSERAGNQQGDAKTSSPCVRLAQAKARAIRARQAREAAEARARIVAASQDDDKQLSSQLLLLRRRATTRNEEQEEDDWLRPRPLTGWELLELKRRLEPGSQDLDRLLGELGEAIGMTLLDDDKLPDQVDSETLLDASRLWVPLSKDQAEDTARKLFDKAADLHRQLMLRDDDAALQSEIAAVAARATKLQSLSRRHSSGEAAPSSQEARGGGGSAQQQRLRRTTASLDTLEYFKVPDPKPVPPPRSIIDILGPETDPKTLRRCGVAVVKSKRATGSPSKTATRALNNDKATAAAPPAS